MEVINSDSGIVVAQGTHQASAKLRSDSIERIKTGIKVQKDDKCQFAESGNDQ
ncbi:hypothetical protein [Pontibacter sp. HSC-36F09]|uniref:hypothetical protein n=1 Tax=Pontibacter sp. HSC-36F09 TaxID=2910966 RepID=UPI00209CE875|nr:hypothetical protein [Pontibacter sp. HSC-36F09]MCP2042275.1 putative secreted Zn-dependent protease [Pontibacter sp. HSC-36F09]